MNKKYRKAIIAGNWKMNKLASEVPAFAESLKSLSEKCDWCDIIICAPYVMLPAALTAFSGSKIGVGAENLSDKPSGAYTGEVSAAMLKDLGIEYTIIGHSERRQYYNETDVSVNAKVHAALEAGIKPIVCVGESLQQREMGITIEHIALQVKAALCGIDAQQAKGITVAYEPIWAIGTGKTATSEQAGEVCGAIRGVIASLYGEETAQAVSILYGGSMNASNASELLDQEDIDGGLIGGASLDPEAFNKIIDAANK